MIPKILGSWVNFTSKLQTIKELRSSEKMRGDAKRQCEIEGVEKKGEESGEGGKEVRREQRCIEREKRKRIDSSRQMREDGRALE